MSMTMSGEGDSSSNERPDVLLISEIESFIETLKPSTFEELGSLGWIEKHHRIEKLTVQAIIEALSYREEYVKEMLVTHEKLTVLVHDIILIELWREEILPSLLNIKKSTSTIITDSQTPCSFTIYTILFHEATCVNLIETVLYHPEMAEILEHDALDLIDYCLRSVNRLLGKEPPAEDEIDLKNPEESDIERQSDVLLFRIGFKCLTILRYIIENIEKINSAVVPRLIVSSDTPVLLSELLVKKPWHRTNSKGAEQVYSDEKSAWIPIKPEERLILGKIEIQVWLAIYQIFLSPRVISTYEIHHYRRAQLLRLSGFLNEVVLDQLAILGEFQRWLQELSMGSNFGPTKSPLILEMLPQYRTALEDEISKRRAEIVEIHKRELLTSNSEQLTEKAKKLASVYDLNVFESVLPSSQCANCGKAAIKRCSRCHLEYYCTRGCQIADWAQHKQACDKILSQ